MKVMAFVGILLLAPSLFGKEGTKSASPNANTKLLLEVPSKDVTVHCSRGSSEVVYPYLYIETELRLYEFLFRGHGEIGDCRRRQKQIREILRNSEKVQVKAVQRFDSANWADMNEPDFDANPAPKLRGREFQHWFFDSIRNEAGACQGYFEHSCQ